MEPVLFELRDGVATIHLNKPDVFNSIAIEMADALRAAMGRARVEARAVVLTGSGRAFCAGADLKSLEAAYAGGGAPVLGELIDAAFNPILQELVDLPMPVIAAVNGPAAGAGVGLALGCDLRIASTAAHFTMAFINIGLVPDTGTAWLLPAIVGYGRAMELSMSGRRVGADEALAIGLVHRLVEPDQLGVEAHAWAAKLAAGPTHAYARTKVLLRRAVETDLATALKAEREEQDRAGRTADHLEGVAAFLAKRPPVYQGRP